MRNYTWILRGNKFVTDVEIKGYKTAKGGRNEIQETKSLLPSPPKKNIKNIFEQACESKERRTEWTK